MYLNKTLPAVLLLTSVTAKPVLSDKRQLSGLSPVLGIIAQSLPQGGLSGVPGVAGVLGGVPSVVTPNAPVVSPSAGVSASVSADLSCTEALAKIDNAIQLSSALMVKNDGKTTTSDILNVLAMLELSLGEDCGVVGLSATANLSGSIGASLGKGTTRDTVSQQEADDGESSNSVSVDLVGGSDDDNEKRDNDECTDVDDLLCTEVHAGIGYDHSQISDVEVSAALNVRDTALTNCTACETALYGIINELQLVFKASADVTVSIPGQPELTAAVQRLRVEAIDDASE